ncbi:MAG: hypothetical protein MPJ24_02285 [Pirellulaceae bacterium]|nr:hypothetical protein [Pirellulaceae bacterium]
MNQVNTPAEAYWNHRQLLADLRPELDQLRKAVDWPGDLGPSQWAQIFVMTYDFKPDLIIELGRGYGNSTCCFLKAIEQMGGKEACRLESLCLNNGFQKRTRPQVEKIVSNDFFEPGDYKICNILEQDFKAMIGEARRVLVFWDAHGFEIAECALGGIMPHLQNREHRVLMHDMTDTRYNDCSREYGDLGLWKGENAVDTDYFIGHINTKVGQALSITDFANRNNMPFFSVEESLHEFYTDAPEKLVEMERLVGQDYFTMWGHWFWYTMSLAKTTKMTFPRFGNKAVVVDEAPVHTEEDTLAKVPMPASGLPSKEQESVAAPKSVWSKMNPFRKVS